jgi:CHAD domain-containing protein
MGQRFSETERKYDAGPHPVPAPPDLAGLTPHTRALPPVRLDAVYHDTPNLTLTSHHITLRRREGGHDEGWHLKLPTARADTRTEVHAPLTPKGTPPPAELRTEIAALLRGHPLTPIVRLRTTRRVVLLLDADGRTLAEVAHDEVTAKLLDGAPTGPGPGPAWTEIEVELGPVGAPDLLDAVEERLLAAGLRRSSAGSKLARALGDALPPAASGVRPADTAPGAAAHTAVTYLHAQLAAILALDPAVRRAEEDAVHRMRVATRRARSALKSFARVLDRTATDPLGAELKWLAAVLGAERDREVLAERLALQLTELDPALVDDRLRHRLRPPRKDTRPDAEGDGDPDADPDAHPNVHAAVVRELDSARYFALLDAFEALLAAPPYRPGADASAQPAAVATVERDRTRLRAAVQTALALPPGDDRDTALHEARKDAKRARYSSEAAELVLGPRAAAHTSRMKAVQQLLGEHQDSVMCRAALAKLREQAQAAGESPAPYDAMARSEQRIAADVEARLPDTWRSADREM